jgi:FkbM family methyltransferase
VTLAARRSDRVIIREVQSTYDELPIQAGDVVLDLGANIGAASRMFLDRDASKVIAIEPDPASVILLRRNLARRPAEVHWAAVGAKAGQTMIYVSRIKPYLTSLFPDAGRVAVRVPVFPLGGLLTRYQPSVVKCDIEFGEYDLDWTLPDFVRVVALEVHIRYDLVFSERRQTDAELRKQRRAAVLLMDTLVDQGFQLIRRSEKLAKDRPIEDRTGLDPLAKSVDAIWSR